MVADDREVHPVEVLVVDDHAPFRRALATVLEAIGSGPITEAATASDAVNAVASRAPGPLLALVDVNLGPDSGIDVTRRLLAADPDATVALISTHDARDLPADAAECGAVAFVAKSELAPDRLVDLITTAAGV